MVNPEVHIASNMSLEVIVQDSATEDHFHTSSVPLGSNCFSNYSDSIICRLLAAGHQVNDWYRLGILTPEYLETINVHWTYYPPAPRWHHIVVIFGFLALFAVGFAGNLLVISAFARRRSLRTPPLLLLMNLSVSDCLISFKSLVVVINSWYGGPVLGLIGCELYGFASGAAGTSSILTLAAIARERAQVISHPLDPSRKLRRKQVFRRIVFVWIVSLMFSGVPLSQVDGLRFVPEGYLTTCSFDLVTTSTTGRIFTMAFVAAAWLTPTLIITHSYTKILHTVYTERRAMDCYGPNHLHSVIVIKRRKSAEVAPMKLAEAERKYFSGQRRKLEIRLAKVSASCVLAWYLSWTPYALVAVIGGAGLGDSITPLMTVIPGATAKLASCVNPFIYSLFSRRFRQEMALAASCFRGARRVVSHGPGQGRRDEKLPRRVFARVWVKVGSRSSSSADD